MFCFVISETGVLRILQPASFGFFNQRLSDSSTSVLRNSKPASCVFFNQRLAKSETGVLRILQPASCEIRNQRLAYSSTGVLHILQPAFCVIFNRRLAESETGVLRIRRLAILEPAYCGFGILQILEPRIADSVSYKFLNRRIADARTGVSRNYTTHTVSTTGGDNARNGCRLFTRTAEHPRPRSGVEVTLTSSETAARRGGKHLSDARHVPCASTSSKRPIQPRPSSQRNSDPCSGTRAKTEARTQLSDASTSTSTITLCAFIPSGIATPTNHAESARERSELRVRSRRWGGASRHDEGARCASMSRSGRMDGPCVGKNFALATRPQITVPNRHARCAHCAERVRV